MAYDGLRLPTTTSIRLLDLRLGDGCSLSEKSFTLRVVDLSDNPPQHVTLSYTCGEPRNDFELRYTPGARSLNEDRGTVIHVNGLDMVIAPNLSQALAQLIHLPDVSLIWIDAICIYSNQSSIKYLNFVRGLMPRILAPRLR